MTQTSQPKSSFVAPALPLVFKLREDGHAALAQALCACDFIGKGENVIIIGAVGSGKFNCVRQFIDAEITPQGKTWFRMHGGLPDLTARDVEEPVVFTGGAVRSPTTAHGLKPELVDCDLLVIDGMPDPAIQKSFSKRLNDLLGLRAQARRSTIILVSV